MMSFTSDEILLSFLYAAIYGVLFFLFYTLISLLKNEIETIKSVPESILQYDKILEKPIKMRGRKTKEQGALIIAASIITFALGLVLLFYYSLDGCVRIYMIAVSLASFFALKALAFDKILVPLASVFDFLIYLLTIALRIILFPLLRLFSFLKRKKIHFLHLFNKNNN